MIKKMEKFSFVIFHKDVDSFLEELSLAGLVDITRSSRAVDQESMAKAQLIREYKDTISWLSKYNSTAEKAGVKRIEIPSETYSDILSAAKRGISNQKTIASEIKILNDELAKAAPWYSFTGNEMESIKSLGYTPHFYTCSAKVFKEEWKELYPLYTVSEGESICFVTLSQTGEEYTFPLNEIQAPSRDASAIEQVIKEAEQRLAENDSLLYSLSCEIDKFKEELKSLNFDLDIYLAKESSQKASEDMLTIFEGFATLESASNVEQLLENMPVYWKRESAKAEDNPPVELKNNFFNRLFEPIGQMYLLPKYDAEDLTPYFGIFYMLFFGLCLGDMGYGVILMIAGLAVNFKMPKMASIGRLVFLLGLGSTIMPLLSGTVFGAKMYELFPMGEDAPEMFLDDMGMFWFAIGFGMVQIIFGRVLNAIFTMKRNGFPNGLNEVGWAILLTWFTFAFDTKTSGIKDMPQWSIYLVYFACALILFFSSNSKNILARIGKGTFAFYDITGLFGDILSYIRLFGLGTAGGILGLVINSISTQLLGIPYAGWLLCGIMLVIGHIMVLFLSALGAFVHPMRLTFVEFYKNAGFDGGGRAFRPLKKEKQTK